jgi:signal transduction histidine kinase
VRAAEQRTDESLTDTANAFVANFKSELNDNEQPDEIVAAETAREFRYKDRELLVYDATYHIIAASEPSATATGKIKARLLHNLPYPPSTLRFLIPLYATGVPSPHCRITPKASAQSPSRCGAERVYITVVAHSLHDQDEALEQARNAIFVAIPLALLLASIGGYLLARRSLAPVVEMGERAARIGASNLNERLPVAKERNELGRLAHIFNDLLARLDRSFEEQRRFMADASHELRTPVAIVRGEAEVALSQTERSTEEYRESLAIVEDEGRRLTRIVEDLFTSHALTPDSTACADKLLSR